MSPNESAIEGKIDEEHVFFDLVICRQKRGDTSNGLGVKMSSQSDGPPPLAIGFHLDCGDAILCHEATNQR